MTETAALELVRGMKEEEALWRLQLVGNFFETLGVRASERRLAGYVVLLSDIPRRLFAAALDEAILNKSGDYQTAPQPNMVMHAAMKLAPEEWEYPSNGFQGGMLPPKWARIHHRRRQLIERGRIPFLEGDEPKRLLIEHALD